MSIKRDDESQTAFAIRRCIRDEEAEACIQELLYAEKTLVGYDHIQLVTALVRTLRDRINARAEGG